MSGEVPDTNVIKARVAYYRAKYKSKRFHGIFGGFDSSTRVPTGARARGRKRQREEIEPAMRHSCYTLTPIHENFTHPPSDSEDTTDSEDYSDMPELEDAEPFKRSESNYGLFRFLTDRTAVGRSAMRKNEKRRSRSTGWKHFREPGGGHIDYSKVLCWRDAVRALVCTLKKDSDRAQIARSLGCNPWCGASMICQTNDVGLHQELRSAFIDRQAENILSVWPGIRPVKTGHAPYICEDIKNTGYETVEVDDSGLASNYRGRGVCPFERFQRDLQEINLPGHEHMTWDMFDKDKHDRMLEDVFESPTHVLCFQEPESDFGKDNHNIPQRLSQHPRLLEALLSPR